MLLRLILVSCHGLVGSPKQKCIDRLPLLIRMGFDYGFFTQWNAEFNIFHLFFLPFGNRFSLRFACFCHMRIPLTTYHDNKFDFIIKDVILNK